MRYFISTFDPDPFSGPVTDWRVLEATFSENAANSGQREAKDRRTQLAAPPEDLILMHSGQASFRTVCRCRDKTDAALIADALGMAQERREAATLAGARLRTEAEKSEGAKRKASKKP